MYVLRVVYLNDGYILVAEEKRLEVTWSLAMSIVLFHLNFIPRFPIINCTEVLQMFFLENFFHYRLLHRLLAKLFLPFSLVATSIRVSLTFSGLIYDDFQVYFTI